MALPPRQGGTAPGRGQVSGDTNVHGRTVCRAVPGAGCGGAGEGCLLSAPSTPELAGDLEKPRTRASCRLWEGGVRVPPWAVRVPAWGCPHPLPQHVSAPGHDSVLVSGKLTLVLGNKRWQGSRGAPLPSRCTGPEGPRGGKGPHAPEACTTPRQDRSSLGSLLPSGSVCCE